MSTQWMLCKYQVLKVNNNSIMQPKNLKKSVKRLIRQSTNTEAVIIGRKQTRQHMHAM